MTQNPASPEQPVVGSDTSKRAALSLRRKLALALSGLLCVCAVGVLVVGVSNRPLRLMVLIAASLAAAFVVVLLPASWRARTGLLATAFLASAGLFATFITEPDETEPQATSSPQAAPSSQATPSSHVNTTYLALLIREGPFTERLPNPLRSRGLEDISVGDAGGGVLDTVALILDWPEEYDPFPGFDGPSAHIETYSSEQSTKSRAEKRLRALMVQYKDFGPAEGTAESFFIFGNGEIIAGGYRGYVYAEAYSFPDSNANLPLARGTVAAILRYGDRMTKLATE